MLFYIVSAIILYCLFMFLLVYLKKNRISRNKSNLPYNWKSNRTINDEKLTFKLSDIVVEMKTQEIIERKKYHSYRKAKENALNEKFFGFIHDEIKRYETKVDFEFPFNDVKIKTIMTFPVEKLTLNIRFGLKENIDIYICKLDPNDYDQESLREYKLSASHFIDGKDVYAFYMDFEFLNNR